MPKLIASIAVPLAVSKAFSYSVPSDLADSIQAGCRVLVPFKNRHLVGLVVDLQEGPSTGGLKAIERVLDPAPILSESLLQLGRWLAWYYFAPLGEAYRVMLPPKLLAKKASPDQSPEEFWPAKRQLAVTEVVAPSEDVRLPERQNQALMRLRSEPLPAVVSKLIQLAGLSRYSIESLARKGLVTLDRVLLNRSPWLQVDVDPPQKHRLNREQREVFAAIEESMQRGDFDSLLVHGVTASGKTEVYLNAISQALKNGKTALMLVPEIGLTPQVSRIFRAWFGSEVAILHSALSDGERFDQWRQIRQGKATVVVGTRSAVFAPLSNLGLIIIDEEHDSSYKQSETPRYHGRDVALKRGQVEKVPVVLGSATPQLETYHNSQSKKVPKYLSMSARILDRSLPEVHIVDMRHEFERHGKAKIISDHLESAIQERLVREEQVLMLLNRRGYASMVICRSCGHTEVCENCSITLTFHQYFNRLSCHYCGYAKSVPSQCHNCGREYVHFSGEGTERVQEILTERFPGVPIDRLDRDTVQRKGSYERILGAFRKRQTQVLIGTQMIAKGHDFPAVTLVGVLGADQALKLADFRSAERTFQLLTQVAGRAGRGTQPGEVVIQTYYPNHYALKFACAQNFELFSRDELQFRRRFRYPPYTALANLLISNRDSSKGLALAEAVRAKLTLYRKEHSDKTRMRVLGPAQAAIERLQRDYRFQIVIKTTDRHELHKVLRASFDALEKEKFDTRKIAIDIDPINLL